MFTIRLLSVVVAVGVVAGCATAPPVEVPELAMAVPEGWTGNELEDGNVSIDWWRDFIDYGLSSAVETAIDQNYDLQAAAARLEQVAFDARIAGGALMPSLQASYNGIRRKQNFVGFPIPGAEDRVLSTVFTNQSSSFDISWEVDLWRKLRAGEQAALAELQRSAAELRGAQLSIAGQTLSLIHI